ncbi:insulin-like peptide receptor [Trichonephila clavata]|uniref:Gamma-aminobutyric acid type B receptor subunit 2 n=1 Tax=Trichonephila clavata TaxID=2740835 RepID=A0A8X6GHX6_TRICU|nr:insulin-like peptide receptor [Trichonephila clavata]
MRVHLYFIFIICSSIQSFDSKCLHDQEGEITRHFYVEEYDLPLRIEVSTRTSHLLVSNILKILLNEVIGYPHVYLIPQDEAIGDNVNETLRKISTCFPSNNCSDVDVYGPEVMINVEVWLVPGFNLERWVATNRIEVLGPLGPIGRTGWYIAEYTVKYFWESNNTVIDHWRAFTLPEVVKYFELSKEELLSITFGNRYCLHKECGEDGVYRPKICQKPDVQCATLLADYPASNFETLKNEITDLELLVNVAWIGDQLEAVVEKRTLDRKYTLFFHRMPMALSSIEKFTHVSFPNCEDVPYSSCEFEINQLEKIVWSKIKSNAPHAFYVLKALSFDQSDYLKLLKRYMLGKTRGFNEEDIACHWMRENIYVWDKWIPVDNKNKTKLYIGGIFPISGIYWKQGGVITAAKMAAKAINENDTLLANYNLTILERDGHCAADAVMNSFIHYVTNETYKTMVGILGPACSDTVEPIAGVAKHFNTIILSYSAEGALFSNRDKYPYFFRTIPENNQFRYVYMKLFKKLGYQRVAALTEDGQKYPEYLSYLQDSMESNGMTFLVNRKFPRDRDNLDMRPYLKDLKDKGAKIIIGDFFDYAARSVMCAAYKMGMTAANGYVWFLPLWFSSNWYDTDKFNSAIPENERISCTTKEMVSAINGHMSLAYKFYADADSIMQEGQRVGDWLNEYYKYSKAENSEISSYGGYAYDAVWVYALALDTLFKENNSHVATLHNEKTSRRLVELLNETKFNGVSGTLYFLGSSRISDVIISQWVNFTVRQIGVYRPTSQSEGILELNETNIKWQTDDGRKPEDGSKEHSNCSVEGLRKLLNVTCDSAVIIANIMGFTCFAVFVMSGIIICKRRYEKRMKITEARMKELGLMANSGPFALDEWEMPRDHIVINRKLGEGAFGTVYGGEADIKDKGWIAVAVKTLKNGAKPEEKLDFLSEAEVMKQFDHINIVKLVGVCTMGEPVYTVMEFMLYGDLKTYLLSRRSIAAQKDRANNDEVSDKRLTNMALDIARGLSYLADKKFVHRDLACRNCLVNISRSVKIADFGMCRAMYDSDYYRYNKKGMLPVRWMAPESLIDGLFTPPSDVWSYGVVLYEIVTFASVPYQGLSNSQVLEHIKNFNTLTVPKGSKPELSALLKKCWARNPQDRPQAVEIVEILAHNPELISPCLDMPMSSVEVMDTGTLELPSHDRVRGHSLSSVWQNCKNIASLDQSDTGLSDSTQVSINGHDNFPLKHGFKFNSKKTLHESFRRIKREMRREKHNDFFPQITYL